MGFQHSAYFAYGFQIPDADPDELDEKLASLRTEVGHLEAGDYDHDSTFLVTSCTAARLGSHKAVSPQSVTPEQYEMWGVQLRAAAAALGVADPPEPDWFLVPDVS